MKKILNILVIIIIICGFYVRIDAEMFYCKDDGNCISGGVIAKSGEEVVFGVQAPDEYENAKRAIVESNKGFCSPDKTSENIEYIDNTMYFVKDSSFWGVQAKFSCKLPGGNGEGTIEFKSTYYDEFGNVIGTKTQKGKYYEIDLNKVEKTAKVDSIEVTSGGKKVSTDEELFTSIEATSDTIVLKANSNVSIYGCTAKNCSIDGKTATIKNIEYGNKEIILTFYNDISSIVSKYMQDDYYWTQKIMDEYDSATNTSEIIKIERKDNRSDDSSLKSLKISNVDIMFNGSVKEYSAEVENNVRSVSVKAECNNQNSILVDGYGNRTVSLREGSNKIQVKCKSEKDTETTYTVTINRKKSNDTSIKYIKVNDEEVKVGDLLTIKVYVENEITNANVEIEPSHDGAKLDCPEINELKEGANLYPFTITASDGTVKKYELNIYRDTSISTDGTLSSLNVNGYDIAFNSEKKEYELKIKEETSLDIKYEVNNLKAKAIITGNKDLKNGSVIKIKVTAESGDETIYSIKIIKESSIKVNKLYIFIGIGSLLIISIVIFIIIKKKNKNKESINSEEIKEDENNDKQNESIKTDNEKETINNEETKPNRKDENKKNL